MKQTEEMQKAKKSFELFQKLVSLKKDLNEVCKTHDDHIAIVALMKLLIDIAIRNDITRESLQEGLDETYAIIAKTP